MTWHYELKWWEDDVTRAGNKELKNVIFVESKPRELGSYGLVDVHAWINYDESNDIITPDQPLIIYTSVTRGNSPVLSARVSAVLEIATNNGSIQRLTPINLFDNGNGGMFTQKHLNLVATGYFFLQV